LVKKKISNYFKRAGGKYSRDMRNGETFLRKATKGRFARYTICLLPLVVSLMAHADSSTVEPSITFSVSADRALKYPSSIKFLPDEHSTILPVPGRPGVHNFFEVMVNVVGSHWYGETFVLQSSNLTNLSFAPGFGKPDHGQAVFWGPHPNDCNYSGVTHFDEQYAGPGSVLQDPTLPLGNLIMVYEAEIHCPKAANGVIAGWVSVGVTRSADGGKNWPLPNAQPGYEHDWLEYGNGRYAAITIPGTPPKTVYNQFYADGLPSAFIDDMDPSGNYYIYVPYTFTGAPGTKADAKIHIARAKIGDHSGHREPDQLHFRKWYKGGWTQEGRGGLEDGIGDKCAPIYGEGGAQIEYNDALGLYMMTFSCTAILCPGGKCAPSKFSLFYSTATSLAAQDWTTPQPIENSTYPYQPDPKSKGNNNIDGGYPSFMSPGCEPGHLGLSGTVFIMKGDGVGERTFASRSFTIKSNGTTRTGDHGAPALANGCRAHPGS
jgi:hypothetical protein